MNHLQLAIFEVIKSIFGNEFINIQTKDSAGKYLKPIIHNSAIRYGILNYVAKFSLANDDYLITQKCAEHLKNKNLINAKGLLRAKKGSRYKFTFEHPVPSNIIGDLLYENRHNEEAMLKILEETNCVTVLTYDEDQQLRNSGLARDMPDNWELFQDSPFCRYSQCNIEVPTMRIPVYGSLAR
tara:strand:+ start:530 stop:1078 length:549 start_codon:yes stop_codon:yes gene_type:complete